MFKRVYMGGVKLREWGIALAEKINQTLWFVFCFDATFSAENEIRWHKKKVRNIGCRNKKRRCCLFTCLTVRAVHSKIVSKLDTDSCLSAIMRFIARRRKPMAMISDNGTNFIGPDRDFMEYVAARNKERIEGHLVQHSIRWRFNPPAAPQFGWLWERLFRKCKNAL